MKAIFDPVVPTLSLLRSLAWNAIKQMPDQTVLNLIFDADRAVRSLAAREVQLRCEKFNVADFQKFLDDDQALRRGMACFILGQFPMPPLIRERVEDRMIELLQHDPEPAVKAEAAAALGHMMAKRAHHALRIGKDDPYALKSAKRFGMYMISGKWREPGSVEGAASG